MQTIIHLIYIDPVNGTWRITSEKSNKVIGTFLSKDDAIASGRQIAKKEHGQLIVRHANGSLEFAEDFASVER